MSDISYEQARKDHSYLWEIGAAADMTGGYVDQEDLAKLLKSPTKSTARNCFCDQIQYWFQAGPSIGSEAAAPIPWDDPMVQEIADRHGVHP